MDTSVGYTGDELKQFINDERMQMDGEKEKEEERNRAENEISEYFEQSMSLLFMSQIS